MADKKKGTESGAVTPVPDNIIESFETKREWQLDMGTSRSKWPQDLPASDHPTDLPEVIKSRGNIHALHDLNTPDNSNLEWMVKEIKRLTDVFIEQRSINPVSTQEDHTLQVNIGIRVVQDVYAKYDHGNLLKRDIARNRSGTERLQQQAEYADQAVISRFSHKSPEGLRAKMRDVLDPLLDRMDEHFSVQLQPSQALEVFPKVWKGHSTNTEAMYGAEPLSELYANHVLKQLHSKARGR